MQGSLGKGPLHISIGAEVVLDDALEGTGRVRVPLEVVLHEAGKGTGSVGVPSVQEAGDGADLGHDESEDELEGSGTVVTAAIIGTAPEEVSEAQFNADKI